MPQLPAALLRGRTNDAGGRRQRAGGDLNCRRLLPRLHLPPRPGPHADGGLLLLLLLRLPLQAGRACSHLRGLQR